MTPQEAFDIVKKLCLELKFKRIKIITTSTTRAEVLDIVQPHYQAIEHILHIEDANGEAAYIARTVIRFLENDNELKHKLDYDHVSNDDTKQSKNIDIYLLGSLS